jgi:hypothetical protein
MSLLHRQWLFSVLALLLAAGIGWWWFDSFEKRWEASSNHSAAARDNPMLAASRLLVLNGFKVRTEATLREAMLKPLAPGTLIVAENGGIVTEEQGKKMLAWAGLGNTLVVRPKRQRDTADKKASEKKSLMFKTAAELVETDPVGAHFGVVLASRSVEGCSCEKSDSRAESDEPPPKEKDQPAVVSVASITMPGAEHPIELDAKYDRLRSTKRASGPQFSDDEEEAVRVYAIGKGHVVLLAKNFFNNHNLERHDHAELLLGLAHLYDQPGRAANQIVFVQNLDMLKWHQALRLNYQAGLISVGVLLLLLLWVAIRRFGPLLPEPDFERRSMIEHIDASGRWLWKVPGGREILLNAARAATIKTMQRRTPELTRWEPAEQSAHLAKFCNLAVADIVNAMQRPAARTPIEFTRQIQTLRQLRKSHER